MALICIPLTANNVELLFVRFFAIWIPSLVKCLFKSFTHFLNWAVCFPNLEFWKFFIYSGYKSFVGYVIYKYFFSQSVASLLIFLLYLLKNRSFTVWSSSVSQFICYKYPYIGFCMNIYLHFSGLNAKEWSCWVIWKVRLVFF